jgi:hypothetical protein
MTMATNATLETTAVGVLAQAPIVYLILYASDFKTKILLEQPS